MKKRKGKKKQNTTQKGVEDAIFGNVAGLVTFSKVLRLHNLKCYHIAQVLNFLKLFSKVQKFNAFKRYNTSKLGTFSIERDLRERNIDMRERDLS